MSLKHLNLFLILTLFALCGLPYMAPSKMALAQGMNEEEEDETVLNLVPRGLFSMIVQRVPDGNDGDFNLHFSNVGVVSGCVGVTEAEINLVFTQQKLDISIEDDAEFELRDDEVRYGVYSCDIQTHTLSFDVKLNRDDLMDRNIKMIGIKSKKYGRYSDTKVDIKKESIIFQNKYPVSSYATFWFYPSNTVILHAPSAKTGQDVGALIDGFAEKNGLVPLAETLKDFELPYWAKNVKYYTDPGGKILNQVASAEKDMQVGVIQPTRTMYGADGPAEQPYDLWLYGRKPGLYD